tara:strand:+ start:504 stop:743 length:240 start_codon:yes stop_codon:yes gene_type:complete
MKINRMTKGNWGKVKAFFDLDCDGVIVKGFKLIEGEKGIFVGMPSVKNKDGEYENTTIVPEASTMHYLLEIAQKEYESQ